MDELLSKHRKEQKDLQARITQKKKSSTKKTRKGINDECDRLQMELSERHNAEIALLNGEPDQSEDNVEDTGMNLDGAITSSLCRTKKSEDTEMGDSPNRTSSSPKPDPESQPAPSARSRRPNRQKARLARRAAEQEAQASVAAEEAASQPDLRGSERDTMVAGFKRLGLREVEIQPDGHCVYSAVALQLEGSGMGLKPDPKRIVLEAATLSRIETVTSAKFDGYRAVRAVAADFITAHREDFDAFMEEPLEEYVRKIKFTGEWGGQLELQAIARAYGANINVIQADGRTEKIECGEVDGEEEEERPAIYLAYYRHTYGLGEHYNALMKQS